MNAVVKLWTGAEYMRTRGREPEQLELGHDERETYRHDASKLLREIGRTISLIGIKEVAFQLQTTEAALTHSVAQRGRHYFRAEWLDYLLKKTPDLGLARALCEPAGLVVERAPEVTPEEALTGLLRAVANHLGPTIAEPLLAEAHREAVAEAKARRGR